MGPNDLIYIAAYVAALCILTNRDAFLCLCVVSISCFYSMSKLFDYSTATQVHLFYIITSLIFIPFAKRWAIKYSMLLMVILNVVMLWDTYSNENVQTWYFLNYSINTSIIHLIIIFSLFYRQRNIIRNNFFYVYLRRMPINSTNFSDNRFLSSGRYFKKDKCFEGGK